MFLEFVISIALLAMIAAVAAQAVNRYAHLRTEYQWRQAARWACEAQLQRVRAGAPIDSRPPDGLLLEGITLTTSVELGRGTWRRFNRVTVTATTKILWRNRRVRESIVGYLPQEPGS